MIWSSCCRVCVNEPGAMVSTNAPPMLAGLLNTTAYPASFFAPCDSRTSSWEPVIVLRSSCRFADIFFCLVIRLSRLERRLACIDCCTERTVGSNQVPITRPRVSPEGCKSIGEGHVLNAEVRILVCCGFHCFFPVVDWLWL